MRKIKMVIIDDEIDNLDDPRREIYEKIFSEFELHLIATEEDFGKLDKNFRTDAFIIDENLYHWRTKALTLDVVLKTISDNFPSCPIIMISKNYFYTGYLENMKRSKHYPIIEWLNYGELKAKYDRKEYVDEITSQIRYHILKAYKWVENTKIKDKFIILHISDLQYNDPNTAKEAYAGEAILARFLKDADLIPHLVVITGDVTSQGSIAGFDEFEEKIKNLFNSLQLNFKDNLIVVPGNHDVDRNLLDVLYDENGIKKKEYYQNLPLLYYRNKISNMINNVNYYNNSESANFIDDRFALWNLKFININTNSNISNKNMKNYELNEIEIAKLINNPENKIGINDLVIGVGHTPIGLTKDCADVTEENYEEIIQEIPIPFVRLVQSTDMKIYLCGHTHSNEFRFVGEGKFGHSLVQSSATSYRLGEKVLNGNRMNGFHIIEIEYSHNKPKRISGRGYSFGKNGISKLTGKGNSFSFTLE